MIVWMLGCDLIFSSKIREAATASGATVKSFKNGTVLRACLDTDTPPSVLIADLAASIGELETILVENGKLLGVRIIGFFSHVDVDLENRALAAGVHEVMPRSKFSKVLPEIFGLEV